MSEAEVPIASRDHWFKIVDFLQQNWALVDEFPSGVRVFFVSDTSGVFDELDFVSAEAAAEALRRNGFRRFAEDSNAQGFLAPPLGPFRRRPHPNGPIYSSGRYWK
jgi:hypothetical protein